MLQQAVNAGRGPQDLAQAVRAETILQGYERLEQMLGSLKEGDIASAKVHRLKAQMKLHAARATVLEQRLAILSRLLNQSDA